MAKSYQNIRQLFSDSNLEKFIEAIGEDKLIELFLIEETIAREKDREEKKKLIPDWFYEKFAEVFGYSPRKAVLGTARMLIVNLGKFLQRNPEYITTKIYNALSELKSFYWVVRHYQIDAKTGAIVPTNRRLRDLQSLQTIKGLDLLKRAEEKIAYMLDLITPQYLEKLAQEHPATFFTSLKTMSSLYHILSIDYKPDEEMIKSLKIVEQDQNNPERKKEFLLKYVRRSNVK
jgi:hypothetical protein